MGFWFGVGAPTMPVLVGKHFLGPGEPLALGLPQRCPLSDYLFGWTVGHRRRNWGESFKCGATGFTLEEWDTRRGGPDKDRSSKGGQASESDLFKHGCVFLPSVKGLSPHRLVRATSLPSTRYQACGMTMVSGSQIILQE